MATTPRFLGPDGVLRSDFSLTTSIPSRFLTGTIGADTDELQVAIRDGQFTSDNELVTFEGTTFTIPNPNAFPEGLDLLDGENLIELRAVSTSGSVSTVAEARLFLVQERDLGFTVQAPTNIRVEQLDGSVRLTVEGIDTPFFQGINFYASTSPGGGAQGYLPINVNLIRDPKTTDENTELANLGGGVASDVLTNPDGTPAADPLFFRLLGTQEDSQGNVLQTDFNLRFEIPETVTRLNVTSAVANVRRVNNFSFEHRRTASQSSLPATIPQGDFAALNDEDPIYYVARAVFLDPLQNQEFESPNSPEVLARPLRVSTQIGSFPLVSRTQIFDSAAIDIFRRQPLLRLDPGSVVRDTIIDPFITDVLRTRLILDFIHRAQSFAELLAIDDPGLSGESVPVPQSRYKLGLKNAFFLVNDTDLQAIIDGAFESLASRVGVFRLAGRRAVGEVTFFTLRRPTASIDIPIGTTVSGGGRTFRTTQAAAITLENIASFFSATTGRYAVRVAIEDTDPGSAGNLIEGQIRTIVVGPSELSVNNENRTFGGLDIETNRDLATRAQARFSSVDTGTLQGYRFNAINVPGVTDITLIEAGNPLMQRDFNTQTGLHEGGKVDVYVRGTQISTITDNFAFRFEILRDAQFEVVGSPSSLRFRAVSTLITVANPIIEMLDIPSFNLGFRNDSSGLPFDLTGVTVESFNTIVLSQSVPQPPVSLTDVVRGDLRFRASDRFVLTRQPVTGLISLTGSVTGAVSDDAFQLNRLADPLKEGRSTLAGDFLQVVETGDPTQTIPSATPVVVTDESHVMIGETVEFLFNLGINPLTLRVFTIDRLTEYVGPFDPSGNNDFTIVDGDETSPAGIVRTDNGNITSGEEVLVDYEHDENFIIAYQSNALVRQVQLELDDQRHATADVVAKESIINTVDFSATVVLRRGVQPATAQTNIQTNLTNLFRGLGNNVPIRPGDMIAAIENTTGVSFVVQPLTKMVRSFGSLIVREPLLSDLIEDVTLVSAWSTISANVFLIEEALDNATSTGGGSVNEFRGVFEDDNELALQIVEPATLGARPAQAFIIGLDGLVIPGVSDDQTLEDAGFTTDAAITAARVALTANRVLVSLATNDSPVNHDYSVTYFVDADTGVKQIEAFQFESLSLGDLTLTFDEDRLL